MAKTKTRTAAQKAARKKADPARGNARPQAETRTTAPGENAAGVKAEDNEADTISKNSADAANEVARRRKEPGAADPENDGPDVGRVDLRPDTSAETQQIPRPARPVATNAVAAPLAAPPGNYKPGEKVDGSLPSIERFAKVRALRTGYFDNQRRRAGDVFWIHSAGEFSKDWMEYAGSSDPEKITTGNEELKKQFDETVKAKRKEAADAGTGSKNVLNAEG